MSPSSAEGPVSAPGRRLLTLLLTVAIAAAVLQPIRSYDLWWHLATGRWIVQEGRIPFEDPYSFTRAGTPWLDHEWLFQVVAFGLHRLGGWRALLGADLVLGLALYGLLAARMRKEGLGDAGSALLLLLSLAGARSRIDPRPEMVSLCFVVLLCFLLARSREPGRAPWIGALPALFLVWANTHPAVLMGATLLLLWVAGEWIQSRGRCFKGRTNRFRLLAAVSSPALILINPAGWRLLQVPAHLRRIITSGHAPNLEWAAPAFRDFPLFYFSAILTTAVVLVAFRKVDLPPTLVVSATALLAFLHLRNIGFFFVLLPLALGKPLASVMGRARFPENPGRLFCAVVLLLVSLLFVRENLSSSGAGGYLAGVAPEKAVRFLEERDIGARLFNDVKFGGYLIWRRYPEHRVFIDGRNEVYDSLLAEIFDALGSWEKWEALLARHRIDAAMLRRGQMQAVRYPPSAPGERGRNEWRAFSASYFQASRWALVYWDDQALLFVRRDDPAAASLLAEEYRFANPDDFSHLLREVEGGRVDRRRVLEELDRKLTQDPECLTARRLRALLEPPGSGESTR